MTSCESKDAFKLEHESRTPKVVVLPHIELLTGVLSIANDQDHRGPNEDGNYYYRELCDFLEDYSDYDVFETSQELSSMGFAYDAPYAFMLHYESIDHLISKIQYSDYVVSRSQDENLLRQFAFDLYELAEDSNFYNEFYMKHIEYYDSLVSNMNENTDWAETTDFISKVYGKTESELKTVLAPAAFTFGGYGIHISNSEKEIFYNLLRSDGASNKDVVYHMDYIPAIAVHEWSHSYVDPIVIQILKDLIDEGKINKLEEFYEPLYEEMKKQAYGSIDRFLSEQIIRGITLNYIEQYMTEEDFQNELNRQESLGFYLTEYTYKVVKEYMESDDDKSYTVLIDELVEGYLDYSH